MTTSLASKLLLALLALGACGTDDPGTPEVVVEQATAGTGTPAVVGASRNTLYWSVAQANTTKLVFGTSLASLPGAASELGVSTGPIAPVGDHVVLGTTKSILRTGVTTPEVGITSSLVDAVGEGPDGMLVWFADGKLQWGASSSEGSAMLRIARATTLLASAKRIYAAGLPSSSSDARLIRFDRATKTGTTAAGSMELAVLFPGGALANAQYRGRLVGASDGAAEWLVTETPEEASTASRAILVSVPDEGEPIVLLDRIGAVSEMFSTSDGFYWQEGDAILSAPKSGGAATLEVHIEGQAGAVADGFVYYVNGSAIERLALD